YPHNLQKWQLEAGYERAEEVPSSPSGSPYMMKQNSTENEVVGGGFSLDYHAEPYRLGLTLDLSGYENRDELHNYDNNPAYKKYSYVKKRSQDSGDLKLFAERTFALGAVGRDDLEIGYDYSRKDGDQQTIYPYDSSAAVKEANETMDFTEDYQALFVNNDLKAGRFGLAGGLRYELTDYRITSKKPIKIDSDFSKLSWNLAPSYMILPDGNFYVSVSRGYFYPVASYFYKAIDKNSADNRPEDLKPEETTCYEIGFKHRLADWLTYSVNYFYMDVADRFLSFYDESGSWKGYKNVGDSINQGVEFEAEGRPLPWLGYNVSFSCIDAEWDKATQLIARWGATPAGDIKENADISGKKVSHVPEYQYRVGLHFYPPVKGLKFNLGISGEGESYVDSWNRYKSGPRCLMDVKVDYCCQNWTFYLSGNNIFDDNSETIYNEAGERNPDGSPKHIYYPGNGRYLEAGVTWKF
ncbi:MAG: TonB-dependent receptor, partial [Deltaproteobacteria bacterium]|nr:TonB-dependent receptor [Deltaproteobacteria bacterium]